MPQLQTPTPKRRRTPKAQATGPNTRLESALAKGSALDAMLWPAASELQVEHFLNRWVENHARPTVRSATYRSYRDCLKRHVLPHLGGYLLSDLTPGHVQALYQLLEQDGVPPRTRYLVHQVLRRAFNQAVRWEILSRNPCATVDRPKYRKKEMQPLGEEEVKRFLEAARGDRLEALYILAITTGLRMGELLALQWEDIDLRQGALSVRHTLIDNGMEFCLGEPKSSKGKRRVTLPAMALKALQTHRSKMEKEGHGSAFVFCTTTGGLVQKSNLRRQSFYRVLEKAKLSRIRFHDLRHTAATLLLAQGVHPKIVQERLGHSQISITLDTYSHVLPSMQKEAAEKLDRLFEDDSGRSS